MSTTLRTAEQLDLTQPLDAEEAPWVVSVGSKTPLRLSAPLGKILKWIDDGAVGPVEDYLGTAITSSELERAVGLLHEAGLLVEPSTPTKDAGREPRIRVNSLFSIQFAILNKPHHFAWLAPFARRSGLVIAFYLAILSSVVGLAVVVIKRATFHDAITTPMPIWGVLAMFILLVVSVSVHEFAHAIVLIFYGGRVRRIGVMLFYLSPAFFCDVTDAWRLPRKEQRSIVALAGVIATFGIAGALTVLTALLNFAHPWLTVAAALLYVGSVANLVPFIKLDGYIALMTFIDEPNLRQRTMQEWKDALALLLAGHFQKIREYNPLRIGFGLASSATPVILLLLLARNFTNASSGLLATGLGAAFTWVAAFLLAHGLYRVVRARPPVKITRMRRVVVGAFAVGLLTLPLTLQVPEHRSGVYWVDGVNIVISPVPPAFVSEPITLKRDGILTATVLGTGRITGERIVSSVPIQALAPNILLEGELGREMGQVIADFDGRVPDYPGSFEVAGTTQSIWKWLGNTLFLRTASVPDENSGEGLSITTDSAWREVS